MKKFLSLVFLIVIIGLFNTVFSQDKIALNIKSKYPIDTVRYFVFPDINANYDELFSKKCVINRDTLIKYPILKCSDDSCKIISFMISNLQNGIFEEFRCNGDRLGELEINMIINARKGSAVYFEDIIVECQNNDRYCLRSIKIILD